MTDQRKLRDYQEAARLFKEAQRLLYATGEAAGVLPKGKRPAAPEARGESVTKASGEHPLIAIAKQKAERHRLTRLRIDEVSLCDAPASPGCFVTLMKGRTGGNALIALARAKREAAAR